MEDTQTPLTLEEVSLLYQKVTDKRHRAILALGTDAGITLEETVSLQPKQISYAEAIINIWTFKGIRRVRLTRNALEILKEFENSGFRMEYSVGYLKNKLPEIIEEAIGRRKSWTALRTTFVLACKRNGVPIEVAIENTGASLELIYDLYKNGTARDYRLPELCSKSLLLNSLKEQPEDFRSKITLYHLW